MFAFRAIALITIIAVLVLFCSGAQVLYLHHNMNRGLGAKGKYQKLYSLSPPGGVYKCLHPHSKDQRQTCFVPLVTSTSPLQHSRHSIHRELLQALKISVATRLHTHGAIRLPTQPSVPKDLSNGNHATQLTPVGSDTHVAEDLQLRNKSTGWTTLPDTPLVSYVHLLRSWTLLLFTWLCLLSHIGRRMYRNSKG